MYPQLAEIFGQSIPAYFTFLVTGFGVATWLASRWAKQCGLDHEAMIDLGLFSLIAGVAGGRILHVLADGFFWDYVHLCTDPSLVEWPISELECRDVEGIWNAAKGVCQPAAADCFAWAAFWRGGLTYYGGLVSGTLFGLWFMRRERFPLLKAADGAGSVIPLGIFFGRMGCFFGGCCFGTTTGLPLGVRFPPWSPASREQFDAGLLAAPHLPSLPVHPAQLYEALGCLVLTALCTLVLRPRKPFDGSIFLVFLGGYSILRFGLEYLRADDRGGLFGVVSTSQWISVLILMACAVAWPILRRHAQRAMAAAASVTTNSTDRT